MVELSPEQEAEEAIEEIVHQLDRQQHHRQREDDPHLRLNQQQQQQKQKRKYRDYKQSLICIASQVHKTIRDGDYYNVQELVSLYSPNILLEENNNGWTAIHFSASHCVPMKWWKYILVQATIARRGSTDGMGTHRANMFTTCRPYPSFPPQIKNHTVDETTNMGQSYMELFFNHWLHPLQWHRIEVHNRAKLLKSSIQQVIQSKYLQKIIKKKVKCFDKLEQFVFLPYYQSTNNNSTNDNEDEEEANESNNNDTNNEGTNEEDDDDEDISQQELKRAQLNSHQYNQIIINVTHFWYRMILLLQFMNQQHDKEDEEAVGGQKNDNGDVMRRMPPILHSLAKTGCCPSLVARLVLSLFPEQARTMDQNGRLPLHIWAITEKLSTATTTTTHTTNNSNNNNGNTEIPSEIHSENNNNNNGDDDNNYNSDNDNEGMLLPLLEVYPEAVFIQDNHNNCSSTSTSRLVPLHLALLSESKSWENDIQPLFAKYPEIIHERVQLPTHYYCDNGGIQNVNYSTSMDYNPDKSTTTHEKKQDEINIHKSNNSSSFDIAEKDPKSKTTLPPTAIPSLTTSSSTTMAVDTSYTLPCFALAAIPHISNENVYIYAQRKLTLSNGGLLWNFYSKKYKQQKFLESKEELICQRLSTIYQLLRMYPNAVDVVYN